MAIPDFQSIMRPLLEYLANGAARNSQETAEALARHFALTEDERAQLLPSGKQRLFINRIAWAKSHMKNAGLLESPKRGWHQITPAGRELLKSHGGPINMTVLSRFPAYQAFRAPKPGSGGNVRSEDADALTPEELIEHGYEQHRSKLAVDVLEKVKASPPAFFEQLVVELLVAMGYGGSRADAGRAVGRGGDGGIDGIIKEDKLGLDTIYVQAKRWEGSVGRPEIQKFAGALQGVRARKGIFITSSTYTPDALAYAANIDSKIVLIDGRTLAELMIDYSVGVARMQVFELKRVDLEYFAAEE
jgi:restriction system protein